MIAINIELHVNNTRVKGILCITQGILIVLYKTTKQAVINPVKVNEVRNMLLAEQVPSAAALELSEATKTKVQKSHLIFESPSMGMLMRYLIENSEFDTSIDFCREVTVTEGASEFVFDFEDIKRWRQTQLNSFSNGIIRSVCSHVIHELEPHTFSSDLWFKKLIVVSNIGIFLFDANDHRAPPSLWPWHKFNRIERKHPNEKIEGVI